MSEKQPMRAGDDVRLAQLIVEHIHRWVERCDTLQEAAKHLGISTRTVTRWLEKTGPGSPRSLRQLAARGRARFITPPSEDEAETWTDD